MVMTISLKPEGKGVPLQRPAFEKRCLDFLVRDIVIHHLYCPAEFPDSLLSIATLHSAKNSTRFESPLLKGQPGAFARDSVERSSTVFYGDVF